MAAHLLTGTKDVIQRIDDVLAGKRTAESLRSELDAATSLSCFTDDDLRVWEIIYHSLPTMTVGNTLVEMKAKLEAEIPRITEQWEQLGKPRMREEWNERRFAKREANDEISEVL